MLTQANTHNILSATRKAASCQTSVVLLADTGLIESLLPRAITGLIGEKIGPDEKEEIDGMASKST